jgi:serine/threonine protein kinase
MTDDLPPAAHPLEDPREDPRFEDIFRRHLEELQENGFFDPEEIIAAHPDFGPAVVEDLQTYIQLRPQETTHSEPEPSALGTLGDYTLRRQIGRGGMGVVYEAWENSMDRRVALKVLPPGVAADERALQRFIREAKTAGQLRHPNVVGVYSTGVREGTPWYAMEFVEGETLAQVLVRLKQVEPEAETVFGKKDRPGFYEKIAEAFAEVADGLQHAHSKGVIHRDIKPSNLILDREGRLRILDFGLAHLEGQESLTATGDFLGTPLYMSPEQARRKKIPVDHRTDIYSLGATIYEMLALRPPFQGKDHQDTLSQIIERDPVELIYYFRKLSRDAQVFMKLWRVVFLY